jgi:hypothetical protein
MSKNLVINEKWHLGVQECQSTHLFFCLGRAQIFLGLRENFCCPEVQSPSADGLCKGTKISNANLIIYVKLFKNFT